MVITYKHFTQKIRYIMVISIFVPRFREGAGTLNLIRPSVCPSVCQSLCHNNFNLGHNFCIITGRALILGMCVHCDITFLMVPCRDLDRDLWPTSRSNLLPSGGPQFPEFACTHKIGYIMVLRLCMGNRKSLVKCTSFHPRSCNFYSNKSFFLLCK